MNQSTVIDHLYQAYLASHTVTTDSRAITPGCIFFALRGEHFDGNAFAPAALEQGAALCVISDARYKVDDRCLVVPDVLQALQRLAAEHRRHLAIPVVGITGTNGKTTTKELVTAVLGRRYRTSATVGNYNNHLGVPLTILAIPPDAEMAVVEMGANHPGEIADLCAIADPDHGLVTNVGRAHLEGFGSFEGVVRTKTELFRHLAGRSAACAAAGAADGAASGQGRGGECFGTGGHGTLFVNADNKILMEQAERLATVPECESLIPAYAPGTPVLLPDMVGQTPLGLVTYGRSAEADVRGTLVGCDPYLHFYFEVGDNVYNVHSHLLGDYNFDNAMAAVCVGLYFGVEPFDIKEAIEQYVPSNNRSQFKRTGRNVLYLDCYNANPSSMAAAIGSFRRLDAQHKVAVIGGMHELGADERKEHRALVDALADCALERCMLVGPEFRGLDLSAGMTLFDDTDALRAHLAEHPVSGCTVLVKGSNTNRLWTIEELL